MQSSEMESKHFTCPALNLMGGWQAQFSHTLSLGCGPRSIKPGVGDTDGKAIVTIEREYSNVSFGFHSFL